MLKKVKFYLLNKLKHCKFELSNRKRRFTQCLKIGIMSVTEMKIHSLIGEIDYLSRSGKRELWGKIAEKRKKIEELRKQL